MSEAVTQGISRYQFYQLRDEGVIEPVSRGLYRLPVLGYPPVTAYRFSGQAFSEGLEHVEAYREN